MAKYTLKILRCEHRKISKVCLASSYQRGSLSFSMYVGHIIITTEVCVSVRKNWISLNLQHTKIYVLLADAKTLSKIFTIIYLHQVNISNVIFVNSAPIFFFWVVFMNQDIHIWHGFQIWVIAEPVTHKNLCSSGRW